MAREDFAHWATQVGTAGTQSNPAVASPPFDCSRASSTVERMICSTPELE